MLLVSFNAHTRVGDQEYFIPRATMSIVPREKAAYKRINPTAANLELSPLLSLAAAVMAAVSRESFRFTSLVAGNNLNLGRRRPRGVGITAWSPPRGGGWVQ